VEKACGWRKYPAQEGTLVTAPLLLIYISEFAGLNLRNLLRFWCTGDLHPAQQNPTEVTNYETHHSHLRSDPYRRRSRRRCHHAQDRAAYRKPSVGHRKPAGTMVAVAPYKPSQVKRRNGMTVSGGNSIL
jgi:hypothetical protein